MIDTCVGIFIAGIKLLFEGIAVIKNVFVLYTIKFIYKLAGPPRLYSHNIP